MAKLFKLSIVTPGKKSIEEEIVSIVTNTTNGKIEFLANHADAIISIMPTVTYFVTSDGNKKYIFTSSGVVYFKNNTMKIVCDSANWPEEIDELRAEEALNRAKERLKHEDTIDRERVSRAMARAMARLELKRHI